jgi:molybdopterin adenylyltransferase
MKASKTIRARILVLSDAASEGRREDLSGPELRRLLEAQGWQVVGYDVLPDEVEQIKRRLETWSDDNDCDVILTSGGTGLAPRDVTPEATRAVIETEVPGIAELMRFEGVKKTRLASLSRGLAGVRNRILIVNLPGSVRGGRESLESILDILPHAIEITQGRTEHRE